jgi:hypothetical protein
MDTCKGCGVVLDNKLKKWATYCNQCYDKGIMFCP